MAKWLSSKVNSRANPPKSPALCRSAARNRKLSRKSFSAKEVSFKVDPGILGGLVVKIGDKVLDGSVAGKLEGLRQTLK
ncbi:MAG: F0F1 ATP synthase subunit delta [Anaerolineales bacterium]|nr:F0F1 ATP synthase subunit delta [Anaerolineales bacterium]